MLKSQRHASQIIVLLFGLIGLLACRTVNESSDSKSKDSKTIIELEIVSKTSIPVPELSGLGICPRKGSNTPILMAVGDSSLDLAGIEGDADWQRFSIGVKSLGSLVSKKANEGKNGSQWEAIACDGQGMLFILKEKDGLIGVFDSELKRLVQTIILEYDGKVPEGWKAEENSRGEGMVLMRNGHILIAKEKNPALLIEYAPSGEGPLGISSKSFLPVSENFALKPQQSIQFSPIKIWNLSSKAKVALEDISELAVAGDGSLYVLSQESRSISQIEARSDCSKDNSEKDERICIKETWTLPKQIVFPEGLVFWNGTIPIVASDDKDKDAKSLFVLKPLRKN